MPITCLVIAVSNLCILVSMVRATVPSTLVLYFFIIIVIPPSMDRATPIITDHAHNEY